MPPAQRIPFAGTAAHRTVGTGVPFSLVWSWAPKLVVAFGARVADGGERMSLVQPPLRAFSSTLRSDFRTLPASSFSNFSTAERVDASALAVSGPNPDDRILVVTVAFDTWPVAGFMVPVMVAVPTAVFDLRRTRAPEHSARSRNRPRPKT